MVQSHSALEQDAREIRRKKVLGIISTRHYTIREIADKLNIPHSTVQRDVTYWSQISDEDMHQHFKTLPLEIKKGITLTDMTIEWLTDIIESDSKDISLDQRMQASRDRLQANELRQKLLDGKARLREVFGLMDSVNKTLDVTGKNIEVIRDDSDRTLSEHV